MGRKKPRDFRNGFHSASEKSEETKLAKLVDDLLRLTTAPSQPNINKSMELHDQLEGIVKEIQTLEQNRDLLVSSSLRRDDATVHHFEQWLQENGAEFEGIRIANFPGYELGLQAKKDLKGSSMIISIPRKLMLTTGAVKDTSFENLLKNDTLLNNMPNVALALVLLYEKFSSSSFWKPYIDILPVSYSTVLYFNREDLEELRGSSVLETALKQIKNICRQYAYLHKIIWTSESPACKLMRKHFTFNQYRWAASTVMTRQNTVPDKSGKGIFNALIPLWDLCNHMNGTITTDYNPEFERSECFALKDFKKEEQIFIFYGARNNADLFIHNGFVFEDNVHDGYWLRLGISKNDSLREKRIKLLEEISINNFDFWIPNDPQPISGDLLAFLRIFNMDDDTLEQWLKKNEKKNDLKGQECNLVDSCLQDKCWKFLQARLKLLLSAYRCTPDEELQLINSSQGSENKKLCVKMREIEKNLLRNALAFVESKIQ